MQQCIFVTERSQKRPHETLRQRCCSIILEQDLPLNHYQEINTQSNTISKAYHTIADKFMPSTKPSKKQKRPILKPWMTSGLMTSSDKKFKLLAISKFSNDPKDYAEYKRYLNYFTNLKKKLRLNYYREKLNSMVMIGLKCGGWLMKSQIGKEKIQILSNVCTMKIRKN